MLATIVLNDRDRSWYAYHGFRSWMLQDIQEPYQVVLNLFNDRAPDFEKLAIGSNAGCNPLIKTYPFHQTFNISAANNLGLHHSTGDYVLFANSDIIYPSSYLRRSIGELRRRGIYYANGSRANLNEQLTKNLKPPVEYSIADSYDHLIGFENLPRSRLTLGLSPWFVRREIAFQVGGFDPAVLCHEDSEFRDRVMHYLRRKEIQECAFSLTDLYGYHLYHPPSDLYEASRISKSILEPRRQRLEADPASTEDVLPTQIDHLESLLKAYFSTTPIQTSRSIRRCSASFLQRIKKAARILIRGE